MSGPWKKVSQPVAVQNLSDIMSQEAAKSLKLKEDKSVRKFTESVSDQHDLPADEDISLDHKESEDSNVIDHIAKVLQCQFDKADDEIKVKEKKRNGDAKISISFDDYRHVPINIVYDSDSEDDGNDKHFTNMKHWDTFETNQKEFACVPKKGYRGGEMVNKHDSVINGRRNACPVTAFPPDFFTGDVAGSDLKLKLQNPVIRFGFKADNRRIQASSHKIKENQATPFLGIDKNYTKLILFKLIYNGMLNKINGVISTGKESVVLHADSNPSFPDMILPKECAIKVFKTTLNEFQTREMYIEADCSFKEHFSEQNSRKMAHMWAKKQRNNMIRLKKIGINCPDMIYLKNHVLVTSFIGSDKKPAPKIKDIILKVDDWASVYEEVVDIMHKMFNVGHMIHADLSEYNILWHDNKCWIIDVPQSVEPMDLETKWTRNTYEKKFFKRKRVPNLKSAEELFHYVTGFKEQWRLYIDETRGFSSGPCPCKANFKNPEL